MADQLKVPDAVRIHLAALYKAQQEAMAKLPEIHAWNQAFNTALEWLGLDSSVPGHYLDFGTGVVTPAPVPTKPTLVQKEEAS